ncbi:hypothetical protein [Schinkia azotoformans]|nr:hypothetical protein [Schinkia azotoformans]MEC1696420.1 hypothetical protein [Schinkia azotoformans]MEC1770190.1 hypothetical protein [Schinkia azotoformans]MED4365718.1 hypothetical protein [Schinkia azotoformans]
MNKVKAKHPPLILPENPIKISTAFEIFQQLKPDKASLGRF